MSPDVRAETLDNGLRVLLIQADRPAAAHVALYCRGGPLFESDARWGLTHLLEHMIFRGAGAFANARALNLAADDFGGEVSGATYRGQLVLDTPVDFGRETDALELLAEMVRAPRFCAFETEKRIVLDEIASALDERGRVTCAEDLALERLFAGHPLAKSIDGDVEGIDRYHLSDVRSFFTSVFHPGTSGLCVVSNKPTAVTHRMARRAFGAWQAKGEALGAPSALKTPSKTRKKLHIARTSDDAQTELALCFRFAATPERRKAARLVARVLDDGPASRFAERIVDTQGLCYSLFCDDSAYGPNGLFHIGADVVHDRLPDLVEAIVHELRRLKKRAPTPIERARIRRRLRRDERHVGVSGAALAHRGALAAYRRKSRLSAVVPRLPPERIVAAASRSFAREVFRPENAVLATVGTTRSKKRIGRALLELSNG